MTVASRRPIIVIIKTRQILNQTADSQTDLDLRCLQDNLYIFPWMVSNIIINVSLFAISLTHAEDDNY